MGVVIVKIKIMPEAPNTDLNQIKIRSEHIISKHKGKLQRSEEQPIAFGLKALILILTIDESFPLEPIEQDLGSIDHVNSVTIEDMRRSL